MRQAVQNSEQVVYPPAAMSDGRSVWGAPQPSIVLLPEKRTEWHTMCESPDVEMTAASPATVQYQPDSQGIMRPVVPMPPPPPFRATAGSNPIAPVPVPVPAAASSVGSSVPPPPVPAPMPPPTPPPARVLAAAAAPAPMIDPLCPWLSEPSIQDPNVDLETFPMRDWIHPLGEDQKFRRIELRPRWTKSGKPMLLGWQFPDRFVMREFPKNPYAKRAHEVFVKLLFCKDWGVTPTSHQEHKI